MATVANPILDAGFAPKLRSVLKEPALEQNDAFTFEVSSSLQNEVMQASAAEDCQFEELRALAWKVLESKGVLAEVRAQLQACVFEAIDQNAASTQVAAARAQNRGPHTSLSEELVAEFLTVRGLQHTLLVFSTEAQLQQATGGHGRKRTEVAADLGLATALSTSSLETSLLEQLLECSAMSASADGSASATTTALDIKVQESNEKRSHRHKSKSTNKHSGEKGSRRLAAESRPAVHVEYALEQASRFDSHHSASDSFPVKAPHGPGPAAHSPRAGHDLDGLHMRGTHSQGVSSVHSKDEVSSRPSRPSSTATLLERGAERGGERTSTSFGIAGATGFGSRAVSESSMPLVTRNRLPPLSTGEGSVSGSGHALSGVRHQPRQVSSPKSSSSTAHVAFSVPSRGPSSPQLSPTSQSHSGQAQTFFHSANHSVQSGSHMSHDSPRISFRSERPHSASVAVAAAAVDSRQNEPSHVMLPAPLVSPPASPKSVSSLRARVGVGLDIEIPDDGHHRAVSEGSNHGLSMLSTVHGPLPKLPAGASAGMPNLDSLDLSGSDEASMARTAPTQEHQEMAAVGSPFSPDLKDGGWHGQDQESSELETSTRVPTPMHTGGGCGMSSSQPWQTLGLSKSLSHEEVSGSAAVEESWQSENITPAASPEVQMS